MTLSEKTNHVSEAIDNLISQFKDKPNFQAFVTSLVNQVQELEVALNDLITERTLETAVGEQLDGIGEILGEDRQGRNDDDYRTALRARILLNVGSGTPEEIVELVSYLTDDKSNELTEYFPAAFTIFVLGALTFTEAFNANTALQSGKPAGVLAHLIYGESPVSELFCYGDTPWFGSTAYVVGNTVMNDTNPAKIYICTTAGTSAATGGPTGTGTSISDGTCVWDYVESIKGLGYDQGKWATVLNPDITQYEIIERTSGDILTARDGSTLIAR